MSVTDRDEPTWQPISMLPAVAVVIDGHLEGAEEQLALLAAAKPKPDVLDDHTLDRVLEVYSVLLIEQNVSTALPVADYAYVLESRRVAHHGPAAALMADDRLRDLYLGSAGEPATVPRETVLP